MNIVIAIPVDENLASFIGKRGSAESIIFYNRKSGSDVIVSLFPSQEDEKVYALAESLLVASQVVLSTVVVDKKFGEALVAASLTSRPLLITDDNDVSNLLGGLGAKNYKIVSKGGVLDAIIAQAGSAAPGSESIRVDLDHAFPVKGIGTVALGVVTRGTLKQHDKLYHTSGKQVLVRSMQSQDVDITLAEVGTRVGVALKDINDDEIEKGDLLTAAAVPRAKELTIQLKASPAAKESVEVENLYGIALKFSYSECIVKSVAGGELVLSLSAPFPAEIGDEVLLIRRQVPRIFASGAVKQVR